MVKRKKIGIYFLFKYDESASLAIYMLNFIRILNRLPDEKKPELVIIYNEHSPIVDMLEIGYPYIELYYYEIIYKKISFLKRVLNKLFRVTGRENLFTTSLLKNVFPNQVESIFPYFKLSLLPEGIKKKWWKADFQECHLPENFTKRDLEWSKEFMNTIVSCNDTLVLSSYDSYADFKNFFSKHITKVKIMHFASLFNKPTASQITGVKKSFQIEYPYFIIANQFWPHKNHFVVLQALALLQKKGIVPKIICTGKTATYRDPNYFNRLNTFIDEHGLSQQFIFTEFINRDEQLALMAGSIAIIQPTLFEGWSTVIEDAKALNIWVLASSIKVNVEQIKQNVSFFDPKSPEQLANLIGDFWNNPPRVIPFDYDVCLDEYLDAAVSILEI